MTVIHKTPESALVSVLLPVYNGAEYLAEAINSIIAQAFQDFELIIIDDGSSDESADIARSFQDRRIFFYQQQNQGLAATLNRGIEIARGKYVARQDQDDISLPERLATQVKFLESHPECGMVGTWAEIWVEKEKSERAHRHPSDNLTLQYELLFNNPFVHSSMMLRKSTLNRVGVYSVDRNRQPPEDYELWSRIARCYEVANIPELLVIYREMPNSMSRSGVSPFINHVVTISSENIAWASHVSTDDPNAVNIAALIHNANHRLVGEPDFRAMSEILQRAVARVSRNDTNLQREAGYKIEQLKYGFSRTKDLGIGKRIVLRLLKAKTNFLRKLRHLGNP